MRGLIAIISHDRTAAVGESEVSDLASTFESVRGVSRRESISAGAFARVIRMAADGRSHVETDGASWVATYGMPLARGNVLGERPENLHGQFSLVSYDQSSAEVLVVGDPYGLQTLYVADRDGKTYVSTSALVLAKHLGAQTSHFGLQYFLRRGRHVGGLTHWQGVERVEPGVLLRFDGRSVERVNYWRPELDRDVEAMGMDEAADHLIGVAVETFRTFLDPDVEYCTNLTGGFDSRLVNLLLREAGIPFRTNTRGPLEHQDVAYAKRIVDITGWEWLHIDRPPDWPDIHPEMLRTALAWGDGHIDALDLSAALWQPDELGTEPILLNGGGPEILRSYNWWHEWHRAGRSTRVDYDALFKTRTLAPADMSILAEDPTEAVRAHLHTRYVQWAEPHAAELNTWQLDMIYAYSNTGHFGLYGPAFGAYGLIQSPFFFRPLYELGASVNWRHRIGVGLMRRAIHRLDPSVAAVPTTMGGPATPVRPGNLHRFHPYLTSVARRTTNKLSTRAIGRPLIKHSGRTPSPIEVEARRNCLDSLRRGPGVEGILAESAHLFDEERVGDLIQHAHDDDFTDSSMLGRVLTVEMVLRETSTATS
ncbi:MAG: hypothetical protein ACR2P0_03335 [Acidimicrobiales bacterium]